ncbi:Membrane protein involved in the export of O-antigen and teichoic acid [Dehalogenimonas formicexedens]|uniref:Membrane protein involved in the export of O-antigen and teichoic acid n=1 Tax=Dehalogenimonas formicexedens TaxID=1839801 RepID=A0A1P8F9N8_9CHLR|nr:polysaccharide biosynthesis C-terminal domain-containing protein [Dehalogenimonas formicexedens]APV45150.1 Membrane protein involved in the export of O-antigen and teichoic acid [Dehalogenimonas formicexedens]
MNQQHRFLSSWPEFTRNTFYTLLTKVFILVSGALATIIIARWLGPEGKGIYSLIVLIPALLAMAGDLGLGIANTYYGRTKRYSIEQLTANSLTQALTIGTVVTTAFLAYYFILQPKFLESVEAVYIILACLTVPLKLFTVYLSCIVLGQYRLSAYNLISLIYNSASVILTAAALIVFNLGIGGMVYAFVLIELTGMIITLLMLRSHVHIRFGFDFAVFSNLLGYGIRGYIGNLVQFLNYRLDLLMIAFFLDAASIGYYSVAVAGAEVLFYLPGAVGTVVLARTPGISVEQANSSTPIICRNTLVISLVSALFLLIFAHIAVEILFGEEFLPAVMPLWLLLPGAVAMSIYKVLGNEMAGRGKPGLLVKASLLGLSINIILNLLLIPRLGIEGAAIATTVAYILIGFVALVIFSKNTGLAMRACVFIDANDLRMYKHLITTLRKKNRRG